MSDNLVLERKTLSHASKKKLMRLVQQAHLSRWDLVEITQQQRGLLTDAKSNSSLEDTWYAYLTRKKL